MHTKKDMQMGIFAQNRLKLWTRYGKDGVYVCKMEPLGHYGLRLTLFKISKGKR